MPLIPIDEADVGRARALRVDFARFWSTEKGDPRDVYDRFISATPLCADATVRRVDRDPAPGLWVTPPVADPDRVLLYLHGGGYQLGHAAAYAGFVSQLTSRIGCAAFILEYPLAPEAPFPAAHDLAVSTLATLGADGGEVVVAGDSAGGGLTLAAIAGVGRRGLNVAAAAVFSPWTDLTLSGDSLQRFAVGDPLLDPAFLRDCADKYVAAGSPADPRISPLWVDKSGFPPLLIQVGTDELLLDDSVRFADAVQREGGTIELEVWQGMHHVFQIHVEHLAAARRALDNVGNFLTTHGRTRRTP